MSQIESNIPGTKPHRTISVIIPSFRSWPLVALTVKSLSRSTIPIEEILVVDSSDDETQARLAREFPQVKIVGVPQRCPPGAARNLGARVATGELLAFLDADAQAAEDWLAVLTDRLDSEGGTGMAGGAVANANPAPIASQVLYWIEFSEFFPKGAGGPRPHLSSSNLLVSKRDFQREGGFAEGYAMAEDLLLSKRWSAGRLYFEPSTQILHRHRDHWKEVLPHLRALGYWSGRYRAENEASGSWIRHLPLSSFLLPFVRLPRIVGRVARAKWSQGLLSLLFSPVLLFALMWWAAGFYTGIREDTKTDRSTR